MTGVGLVCIHLAYRATEGTSASNRTGKEPRSVFNHLHTREILRSFYLISDS